MPGAPGQLFRPASRGPRALGSRAAGTHWTASAGSQIRTRPIGRDCQEPPLGGMGMGRGIAAALINGLPQAVRNAAEAGFSNELTLYVNVARPAQSSSMATGR